MFFSDSNKLDTQKALLSLLKLALVFQTMGFAMEAFFYGSAIGKFFWLKFAISDQWAFSMDRLIVASVLVLSLVSLWKSYFSAFFAIFLYGLFRAFCIYYNGGSYLSELAFFTQMARYTMPLALAISCLKMRSPLAFVWSIKIAIAVTFVAHGFEALNLHPKFVDFIIKTFRIYLGVSVSEATCHYMLFVIGVADILAAIALLIVNSKASIVYMAFWGALTAICRILYDPTNGLADTLSRVSHFAIPLALYMFYFSKVAGKQFASGKTKLEFRS